MPTPEPTAPLAPHTPSAQALPPSGASVWQALRAIPGLCGQLYPKGDVLSRLMRGQLALQMLWRLGLHLRLLRFYQADPLGAELLPHQPYLLRKIHRVYPHRGLTPAQRADWQMQHHRWMLTLLGETLARQALLDDTAVACRVALPKGAGLLPVRLRPASNKHHREGDLVLELCDPFGTRLYALAFSFETTPQGPGVLVGALQGQTVSADTARHITKLSLGLRPINLLVFVLQTLAWHWGVVQVRAVGLTRHIYAGHHLASQVRFDYDEFWASVGGVPDGAGFFILPRQPQRRERQDIPSHKRSQYQRRYDWMDTLAQDIGQWVATHRATQPADAPASVPPGAQRPAA